jgi:hypothetical protein
LKDKKLKIPTIFRDDKVEQKSNSEKCGADITRHPTPSEIEDVIKRIKQIRDLSAEIDRVEVDIKELAHLIALNLHYKAAWKGAHILRVRGKDRLKKVKKRWNDKSIEKYNRQKHLKALTEAETRKLFAYEDSKRLGSLTKKHPYFDRFIYDLNRIFIGKTTYRYRYMAAIFNAFNFHPENFCGDCKNFDHSNDICGRKKIFTCPQHSKARDKIRKNVNRIDNQIPSAKFPR